MQSVSCLKDIEKFGIFLLTGEACNLYMRCLCDYSKRGKILLGKRFGVADFQGGEPWNSKTGNEEHVGSVMLAYDDWRSLGVLGLLLSGCKWAIETGYVTNPVHDVVRLRNAVRKAVVSRDEAVSEAIRAGENAVGSEAASLKAYADVMEELREALVAAPDYRGTAAPGTVYGFSKGEEETMNEWIQTMQSRGVSVRIYTGTGHPGEGFRNEHQMSGRTE